VRLGPIVLTENDLDEVRGSKGCGVKRDGADFLEPAGIGKEDAVDGAITGDGDAIDDGVTRRAKCLDDRDERRVDLALFQRHREARRMIEKDRAVIIRDERLGV
jgi:hypothetical protein